MNCSFSIENGSLYFFLFASFIDGHGMRACIHQRIALAVNVHSSKSAFTIVVQSTHILSQFCSYLSIFIFFRIDVRVYLIFFFKYSKFITLEEEKKLNLVGSVEIKKFKKEKKFQKRRKPKEEPWGVKHCPLLAIFAWDQKSLHA